MSNHHTKEVEQVFEQGWEFVPDMSHPKNQELGYYVSCLFDGAYGWYTKANHPRKDRPAGDSRPRWQAAKTVLEVWS